MQPLDAIFLVGQMPQQSVIYTRELFQLSNEAKIVQFGKDDTVARHDKEEGFVYFLEAELVTELLEMIASKHSSRETKAEFVCHDATWDAYPDWATDLQDARNRASASGRNQPVAATAGFSTWQPAMLSMNGRVRPEAVIHRTAFTRPDIGYSSPRGSRLALHRTPVSAGT